MCEICDNIFFFSEKQRIQLNKELNVDGVVDDAINQLYNDREVKNKTLVKLIKSHYQPLKEAVEEGYGKPIVKIEYGTPNYEFLKNLQTNTATFAAFKSHASIKDMVALLKDENGNLRSRDDFKLKALAIDKDYRASKLDAEYDTAVRASRMAANWQRYEKNKRLYPNLKYLLTKASKPDEKHLKYVGIIRPVDDAFWNTHYPPNRWRCQCSVEPTTDDATDIPNNLPPVPKDFAFNSGKLAQAFDIENSDYIKKANAKEQPGLIRKAKKIVNDDIAASLPYQQVYASKKGATIEAHPLAFNDNDFQKNLTNSRVLANNGYAVKLLPDIHNKELRKQLLNYDGVKGNKNPDCLLNEEFVADIKEVTGTSKSTIGHAMSNAKNQCNNIILAFNDNYSKTKYQVIRDVKNKMDKDEMVDVKNVFILYKGELLKNPHKK